MQVLGVTDNENFGRSLKREVTDKWVVGLEIKMSNDSLIMNFKNFKLKGIWSGLEICRWRAQNVFSDKEDTDEKI